MCQQTWAPETHLPSEVGKKRREKCYENVTFLVFRKCETWDTVIGITFILVFLNYQMTNYFEINTALRVAMYK